jgi:nicotinamidase-related amidase
VQNDVVTNAHERDAVIENINKLVDKARAESVPVVWVQHVSDELALDTHGWEYVPELQREDSEAVVLKEHGDSFEATTLENVLAEGSVGKVVVTGAQTDACVRSTLHGAFVRGYDTVLVSDAHTTDDYSEYGMPSAADVIAHTNFYWKFQTAPGRQAEVIPTDEVSF